MSCTYRQETMLERSGKNAIRFRAVINVMPGAFSNSFNSYIINDSNHNEKE